MKQYDREYVELSREEAEEFYNRWLRTIAIGTDPDNCYFFNKKDRDGISLGKCIDKYLNYYPGDEIRFFMRSDPSFDIEKYHLSESRIRNVIRETIFDILSEEGIHIKPENKGKFTATKKRTGKSTEELKHSKNPLTRKRAVFAQNAKKWAKNRKK